MKWYHFQVSLTMVLDIMKNQIKTRNMPNTQANTHVNNLVRQHDAYDSPSVNEIPKLFKVGVIGVGVVGSSVIQSFKQLDLPVLAFDKYKNTGTLEQMLTNDINFLCLPTVYDHNTNQYDKAPINETCAYLAANNYKGVIVIKSTVEPMTTINLAELYPKLVLFHNPEFLTAKTAFEDFHNQKHIIIGYTSSKDDIATVQLAVFFATHYPQAEISICTSTESECTKIFCNNFYAVKIQCFNEFYFTSRAVGADYDRVRELMIKNGWINPMHTTVPGSDGQFSFGGMCFPKDTNALLSFMKSNDIPCSVLEATVAERNSMRED